MDTTEYWKECLSESAESCGAVLTDAQLDTIANDVKVSHDNYGMAFYSPPASDRISDIEREWKKKLADQEREFACYRANAEKAVGKALRQHPSDDISIGKHGEVFRHGGRTTQIQ